MKNNVGEIDRVVRIILAIIVIALGLAFQMWLVALGAVLLITGIVGWCPLYSLLGITTAKAEEQKQG